eukprot:603827-Prorocentrum_minimum.AAC.1
MLRSHQTGPLYPPRRGTVYERQGRCKRVSFREGPLELSRKRRFPLERQFGSDVSFSKLSPGMLAADAALVAIDVTATPLNCLWRVILHSRHSDRVVFLSAAEHGDEDPFGDIVDHRPCPTTSRAYPSQQRPYWVRIPYSGVLGRAVLAVCSFYSNESTLSPRVQRKNANLWEKLTSKLSRCIRYGHSAPFSRPCWNRVLFTALFLFFLMGTTPTMAL